MAVAGATDQPRLESPALGRYASGQGVIRADKQVNQALKFLGRELGPPDCLGLSRPPCGLACRPTLAVPPVQPGLDS